MKVMMLQSLMSKKTNTEKYSWNLAHLFAGDDDPAMSAYQETFKNDCERFSHVWRENNEYVTNPEVLANALDQYNTLVHEYDNVGKVAMYWILRSVQEQTNENVKAKKTEAIEFATKVTSGLAFFSIAVSKIPKELQEEFLRYPKLIPYKHHLEQLFAAAKHVLSEKEEIILLKKQAVSHDRWVEMIEEALAKESRSIVLEDGNKVKKSFDELMSISLHNESELVRNKAASHIHAIQRKIAPWATSELNTVLYNKKIDDELRNFERPDAERFIADDIDEHIVEALVSAVTENFYVPQRLYKLKAALFNKKKLRYHERMLTFGSFDKTYDIEEGINIVSQVYSHLDPEFGEMFQSFLDRGLLDANPRKGKLDGAACYSAMPHLPPFFYQNYHGKLRDLMTLAHEAGHATHYEYSRKAQNALQHDVGKGLAEVASTFFESFVTDEVIAQLDDSSKLAFLVSELDAHISAIHRQIALYNFETELHQQFRKSMNISQKEIGNLFLKHMGSYMGDGVSLDKGSENWWVYWSHIRMFFYVYSYASGQLISKALRHEVLSDKSFVEKIKVFLSAGQSKSTRDIFLDIGIDIADKAFWHKGLAEIETELIVAEELAKKLGYAV